MTQKLPYEFVYQKFIENSCLLLETEYKNNRTPLKYICKCGAESKITYSNFVKGKRCQKCKAKTNSEKQRLDFDYVKSVIEREGYKVLDGKYENNQSKIMVRCPEDHLSFIWFGGFQLGNKCKFCGINRRSKTNHYKWNPDREAIKSNNLFAKRCLGALENSLRAVGKKKNTKSYMLNGYSWKDLRDHIQSHPNWEGVKDGNWELDHIYPIKAFVEYGLTELHHIKTINGLDNLQPLLKKDNGSKKDKYDKQKFEEWLKEKGVKFNSL